MSVAESRARLPQTPLFVSRHTYRPRLAARPAADLLQDAPVVREKQPVTEKRSETDAATAPQFREITFFVRSTAQAPVDERFLRVLRKYYPGAGLILVDEAAGTWRRYHVAKTASSSMLFDKQGARPHSLLATTYDDPLLEAIRCCKTRWFVVMKGSSEHPAERIAAMISELNRGRDLVVSSQFAAAHGGNATEEKQMERELPAARKKLRKLDRHIDDPFTSFFAARTAVLAPHLEQLRERRRKGAPLLLDLLIDSNRRFSMLQLHHAPFYCPGFIATKHLS